MKRIMIIAAAAIAVSASAQNNNNVAEYLAKTATVYMASEGKPAKLATPTAMASQATYIYDNKVLETEVPVGSDTLRHSWDYAKRRTAVSGISAGITAGFVQMAENSSPVGGLQLTMAWKRVELSAGGLLGMSKYNNESSKAGKTFLCPIAFAELGYIPYRFPMKGYDNQGYLSVGAGVQYVFDRNANDAGTNTYDNGSQIVTEHRQFSVEGNSTSIYAYVKVRFALKHMGGSALSIKGFGGIFNRYYMDGSRRKAIVGATVAWEFSGAKKRVDNNVEVLAESLKRGDYTLISDVIAKTNKMRAAGTIK